MTDKKRALGMTNVSKNFQTRIPLEARKILGVKEGEKVIWVLKQSDVCVERA